MKTEGLPKCERIVSKKLLDELFNSGQSQSLTAFPLRAVWNNLPNSLPQPLQKEGGREGSIQVLFSVPKRRFKHAVDRNRVKRQLREAYRHHKHLLSVASSSKQETTSPPLLLERLEQASLLIAFIWLSDQHMPSSQIEKRMVQLLTRIATKIQTPTPDAP